MPSDVRDTPVFCNVAEEAVAPRDARLFAALIPRLSG